MGLAQCSAFDRLRLSGCCVGPIPKPPLSLSLSKPAQHPLSLSLSKDHSVNPSPR